MRLGSFFTGFGVPVALSDLGELGDLGDLASFLAGLLGGLFGDFVPFFPPLPFFPFTIPARAARSSSNLSYCHRLKSAAKYYLKLTFQRFIIWKAKLALHLSRQRNEQSNIPFPPPPENAKKYV